MVSIDILQRYPFFEGMDIESVQAIASCAQVFEFRAGDSFYETDKPAENIYLLLNGRVESYLIVSLPEYQNMPKEYFLGEVNPGSIFGLSGLIEPFTHSSTTRASRDGSAVRIDAGALRKLCEENPVFGYLVMKQLSKALKDRLLRTRVQLAATRAN